MLIAAVAMGAHGAVSMSAQIIGKQAIAFFEAIIGGDYEAARRINEQIYLLYKTFDVGNYYSAMKEVMRLLGRPVGPPRRPLLPVTDAERETIVDLLQQAGLLDPSAKNRIPAGSVAS